MYHICFHSSINRHLNCFDTLVIVYSNEMNTGVHFSFWIMIFSGVRRHYWQNGGTASIPSPHLAGPRMKELGLVILTCSFLSLVELTGKNVKELIVLERNMRKHKAFCSCAQKIICSRIFTKNVPGCSLRRGKDYYLRPVCEGNVYGKRSLLSLRFRIN